MIYACWCHPGPPGLGLSPSYHFFRDCLGKLGSQEAADENTVREGIWVPQVVFLRYSNGSMHMPGVRGLVLASCWPIFHGLCFLSFPCLGEYGGLLPNCSGGKIRPSECIWFQRIKSKQTELCAIWFRVLRFNNDQTSLLWIGKCLSKLMCQFTVAKLWGQPMFSHWGMDLEDVVCIYTHIYINCF